MYCAAVGRPDQCSATDWPLACDSGFWAHVLMLTPSTTRAGKAAATDSDSVVNWATARTSMDQSCGVRCVVREFKPKIDYCMIRATESTYHPYAVRKDILQSDDYSLGGYGLWSLAQACLARHHSI